AEFVNLDKTRQANLSCKIGTMAWIEGIWGQCFKIIPCLCEAIFIGISPLSSTVWPTAVSISNLLCLGI
ncbi:hypothetical protein, partial [Escherichia coli]|uniref:hypothetical protein n=1 Tax=Escherichia coli TaxID=562 RepID=UPI001BDB9D3B